MNCALAVSGRAGSAVTSAVTWTEFPDTTGQTLTECTDTFEGFIARLKAVPESPTKTACPLLKLASFGDKKSSKGSLRHNANVTEIHGVEGDYDGEVMSMEDAIARLEQHGIRGGVYPSPSWTREKPRWRVVCPTSTKLSPQRHRALAARVNGALGGVLSKESFTLSQSYYYGPTPTNDYRVLITYGDPNMGRCIDEIAELDAIAIDKDAPAPGPQAEQKPTSEPHGVEIFKQAEARLGRKITDGDGRRALLMQFIGEQVARGVGTEVIGLALESIVHHYFDSPDTLDWKNIAQIIKDFQAKKVAQDEAALNEEGGAKLSDFHAYMPGHSYIYVPTRELWPASSVDGRLPWPLSGQKKIRPSSWLDQNRPVEQMTWDPNEPALIKDRVMQVSGYARHEGAAVFNLYRAPEFGTGDASKAGPWREHLRCVYPEDAAHIEKYLAFKLQYPGVKINHALVLGGAMGIGKDTLLEPIKVGVGPWNWNEVSPAQMLGRFNGWAKAVILRINEGRDLGDVNRFAFYDHSKTYLAAPPDVVRVDEKNLREHYVVNVCGVLITTNHKTDGIYVPADDRRHYIAWSDATKEEFAAQYWNKLYQWYAAGGTGHVIAHLMALNLDGFDPKAPPPKTPAFWAVVQASEAPESGELRDIIDHLKSPAALTLEMLIKAAETLEMWDLRNELNDRKTRRAIPHKLDRVGYAPVRNPDAESGLFVVAGRRQVVYAPTKFALAEQIKAARVCS